ncbi:MAG: alkaline phosphatase family protein [Anaerolineales bacterium]
MRVLVIAIDGATFDILDPWLAGGHLPHMARLVGQGVKTPLMSVFPPLTPAAWSSFMTGKNPAKHGILEFLQRKADSYAPEPMNAGLRRGRSLWHLLSEAGQRVVVVNVPLTYPPEPVRGALVAGMPVPEKRADFTYPPPLAREIRAWLPDYAINANTVYVRGQAEAFLADVRAKLEQRLTVAERLIEREQPDFAMVHILGTDRIQHEFWHCMDEAHSQHKGEALRYKNAIRDFFAEVDAGLPRLLRFADDSTTVMLVSDHGFGPLERFVYLNTWLWQEGFLVLRRDALTRLKTLAFRAGFAPTNIYHWVERLGLGGMRGGMSMSSRQKLLDTLFLSFQDVDWSRTRAYARGNFGQIFINKAGREPAGIVQPGTDYDHTVAEIIARAEATLRDPHTGDTLLAAAQRREALFTGTPEQLDRAPDIALLMRDEATVPLGTADFPANRVVDRAFGNTGDHRMNGIGILSGAGIQPGTLESASLMDIAPTVLHLLGQPVPEDMDGRVLTEALLPERRDVSYAPVRDEATSDQRQAEYTAAEEAELMQHLHDLGYLG